MYHISHILFLLLCQSTVNDDRDLTIRSHRGYDDRKIGRIMSATRKPRDSVNA